MLKFSIRRSHRLAFVSMAAWCLAGPALAVESIGEGLQLRVDNLLFTGELELRGRSIASNRILPELYANRDFTRAWTDPERVAEFLALIRAAERDGLSPDDYFVDELTALIDEQRQDSNPQLAADLDIMLTDSLIRYGYHQRFGKVNPATIDTNINYRRELLANSRTPDVFQAAIDAPSLEQFLVDRIPRGPIYRQLADSLARHREMAAAGGWPAVTPGATLHPGDQDSRVVQLRRRLAATGDLPASANTRSDAFDAALEQAVKAFQQRHELAADGIVGAGTYEALNVPVERRIEQLRLSLERLRWVWAERSDAFVAVNIAGFRVFFIRDDKIEWIARAQVGKTYRQTPVFRGDIAYLELNPTWTVPPGILRNDVLPAIRRDPGYLQRKNMSVIDGNGRKIDPATVDWAQYKGSPSYTFRQEPGPGNALGRIKFIFPNQHFVFLHDTPSRSLFARSERTFSSGCIRVENPFELAELVMADPSRYNAAEFQSILDSKKTQRLYLDERMPVLILYLTAMLDQEGRTRFMKDPYQRDAALLAALNGEVTIDLPEGAEAISAR